MSYRTPPAQLLETEEPSEEDLAEAESASEKEWWRRMQDLERAAAVAARKVKGPAAKKKVGALRKLLDNIQDAIAGMGRPSAAEVA